MTVKSKFIGIHSKRIFRFGYTYVKIRYEKFHCLVIVDNMKEDWFCLKNYGSFKGSSTCCVRYVPSDLKMTEKYGSLNGTQHSAQFQYGY